jgi:hypothetical protein
MNDQRLFPHVGMQVPVSYAMLERLAQEGQAQANSEPGATAGPNRAAWEDIVTSHVDATASAGLAGAVCETLRITLGPRAGG